MFELLLGLTLGLPLHTVNNNDLPSVPPAQEIQIEEPISTFPELTSSTTPILAAHSALAIDLTSGQIIYTQNSSDQVQIASLTKIMTALIILQETPLADIATVPYEATQIGGSSMHLQNEEEISVSELLHGLLIQSGNDAAITLAIHNSGSVEAFVEKMNQKAQDFNLQNTSFQNPMGFDHTYNYSSAQDLSLLAQELYKSKTAKEIVSNKNYLAKSSNEQIVHDLKNTNQLLNTYTDIIGLKTGRTDLAGECFIGITNSNHPTLTVILGSTKRFQDTEVLLDWIQNSYNYN